LRATHASARRRRRIERRWRLCGSGKRLCCSGSSGADSDRLN
jgi:hypothetical protein